MLFEIDPEAQRELSLIERTMERRKHLQRRKGKPTRGNKLNTIMEKASYSSGHSEQFRKI